MLIFKAIPLMYWYYYTDIFTVLQWYMHSPAYGNMVYSYLMPRYWEYFVTSLGKESYIPPLPYCMFIFSLHKQSLTSYSKEPYANFLHLSVNHHFILRVMSHLFILRVNFHLSISRIIHHFSRLRTIPNLLMLRVLPHLTISRGNPLSPNKK